MSANTTKEDSSHAYIVETTPPQSPIKGEGQSSSLVTSEEESGQDKGRLCIGYSEMGKDIKYPVTEGQQQISGVLCI